MEIVTPGAANIALFVSAALALLLVPGPAVLYIIARSVEQGRLAGFISDLGIHTATLVHVAAAALGLDYAGVDLMPVPPATGAASPCIQVIEVNGVAAWQGLQRVTGFPIAQARPCIAAMPTRRPVNEPGPDPTAKTSISASPTRCCPSNAMRSAGTRAACERAGSAASSAWSGRATSRSPPR